MKQHDAGDCSAVWSTQVLYLNVFELLRKNCAEMAEWVPLPYAVHFQIPKVHREGIKSMKC